MMIPNNLTTAIKVNTYTPDYSKLNQLTLR